LMERQVARRLPRRGGRARNGVRSVHVFPAESNAVAAKRRATSGVLAHGWAADRRAELASAIERSWTKADVLRSKREDMTLRRVRPEGFPSVIVRIWRHRSAADWLRRAAGVGDGRREWRAMRAMAQAGAHVAEPLLLTTLELPDEGRRRALIVQDLGECQRAADRLNEALAADDLETVERIEDAVIESTLRMLSAGFTDDDHTLRNFGVTPCGRIVRLDLEFARRGIPWAPRASRIGRMLGELIVSHAFATQDIAIERTERFAKRLAEAVKPGSAALRRAKIEIDRRLEQQRRNRGVETRLRLPW